MSGDKINHPPHYGGADNPVEAIKVVEGHDLGLHLGTAVIYILRAGKKPGEDELDDLMKAMWYLERKIRMLQKERTDTEARQAQQPREKKR